MEDEVARFWREFEEETGEHVEAKSVGELYEGTGGEGVWGVLVLTDRNLWFKPVPSTNWMASLFRTRTPLPSSPNAAEKPLRIPREGLLALAEPEARGWFSRPAFPILTATWQEGGEVHSRRFSVDPSTDLLARLRALCPQPGA
ncbi:MAG TPA: hypothetical protein VN436_15890 [Holophaga sp.]|nr:hypothetical protein [Holophaga sp.]